MPRISDVQRQARRSQILDAAYRCFDRGGLHATTMDDIVRASGLSAGAVYGYFASKDELIAAAVTNALTDLTERLDAAWSGDPPPAPADALRAATEVVAAFVERDGYNLGRIAVHGWSEAQRNDRLRAAVGAFYVGFRDRLAGLAARWRKNGVTDPAADPEDVARTMLSLLLGFLVQSVILGDAGPNRHADGLAAMVQGHSLRPRT